MATLFGNGWTSRILERGGWQDAHERFRQAEPLQNELVSLMNFSKLVSGIYLRRELLEFAVAKIQLIGVTIPELSYSIIISATLRTL